MAEPLPHPYGWDLDPEAEEPPPLDPTRQILAYLDALGRLPSRPDGASRRIEGRWHPTWPVVTPLWEHPYMFACGEPFVARIEYCSLPPALFADMTKNSARAESSRPRWAVFLIHPQAADRAREVVPIADYAAMRVVEIPHWAGATLLYPSRWTARPELEVRAERNRYHAQHTIVPESADGEPVAQRLA